jgi:hypothetical protein
VKDLPIDRIPGKAHFPHLVNAIIAMPAYPAQVTMIPGPYSGTTAAVTLQVKYLQIIPIRMAIGLYHLILKIVE